MIIWIASYPKSGNTWIRYFLKSYFNSSDKNFSLDAKNNDDFYSTTFPNIFLLNDMKIDYFNFGNIIKNWIPMQDFINLNNQTNFLKTHNAMCTINNYHFTNISNTLGAIYIVRDPRSIVASFADHFQISHKETVENMFSSEHGETPIINGKSYYQSIMGTWSDHYNSWTKNNKNLLVIKYEDLLSNKKKETTKIINFINNFINISISNEKINNCLSTTTFENMQSMEEKGLFTENNIDEKIGKKIKFFNKGKINEWKNFLDYKIRIELEKKFKNEMSELKYI